MYGIHCVLYRWTNGILRPLAGLLEVSMARGCWEISRGCWEISRGHLAISYRGCRDDFLKRIVLF